MRGGAKAKNGYALKCAGNAVKSRETRSKAMATKVMDRLVVVDWVDQFEAYLAGEGCGAASIEAYLADVRVFCRFYQTANGQPFEPGLLTSLDLREFRGWSLREQGVAPATWNRRMASLQALCEWSLRAGLVNYNPFQGIERADEVVLAPRWLEAGEFKRFMRQVERDVQTARSAYQQRLTIRDAAVVGLMVYAGLREAEVCALEVGDVAIGERSGSVVVRLGKGEKKRTVPLGKEARAALGKWLELRGTEDGEGRLFVGKKGVPLSERGVQKVVAAIGEACGVDVSPHQLRHCCAKRMLDQGTPLTVIQKILGHEKLETTARYVQPGRSDLEKAVEDL
jgi:site-specific recombinase XerC